MAGLRDLIKKRMDAIDKVGEAPPEKAPAPQPAATRVSTPPVTAEDAAKKAARFKWERDNPGVPYKEPLPGKAGGGLIGGKGTGTSDSNLVPLSKGEFVLPADTVKKLGVRNLRDLIDETHVPVPGRPKGLANGGPPLYDVEETTMSKFKKARAEQNARMAANKVVPDFNTLRAGGGAGSIPHAGVEIPQQLDKVLNPSNVGNMEVPNSLRAGGKMLGGAAQWAARKAPLVEGAIETYGAGRDMLDTQDTGLRVARGAESVGRLAAIGAGAAGGGALGTALFPGPGTAAGMAIGGTLGAFAPEATSAALQFANEKLGGEADLRLPSTKIDAARNPAAPVDAPAKPTVPKADLPPGYVETTVNNAQAGQYQDATDRRAISQGIRTPLTANPASQSAMKATDVAKKISQGANAMDLEAPEGGGYISGTDKDGLKRTVGYTKDTMPAPMGVTDTSTPEQKAADAANRARWTAESAAIDKRMADRDTADRERFQRMDALNKKNTAEYERRDIADKLTRNARAYRPEELAGLQNAYKDAGYRVLESTRGLKDLDETQADRAKQKLIADTTAARDDKGLRGQMYQADQKLIGDKMQAEGTVAAANIKARYDAWKDRMSANKDNREAYSKLMESEFQFMDDKGNFKTDPVGAQQFEKWVTTRAMNDKSFLKAMKVGDIDELNATQWRGLVQDYKKEMSLARYSGDATRGPPTRASVRDIKLSDALPSWMTGDQVENKVGVGEALNATFNPTTTGTLREQAVQIGFKDGKPIVKAAGSMTPEDVSQAIEFMRAQGQNKEADALARRYNTTNQAFGR
jgi:hypothetical protein